MSNETWFVIVWIVSAVFSVTREILLMAHEGKVDGEGRIMIFLSLFPVISTIFAIALIILDVDRQISRWYNEPRRLARRLERKIRKRRRGPLVRLVEYLHNKNKGKGNEN